MNIFQAIDMMRNGHLVRNENFASGCYCSMEPDETIYDPELGFIQVPEFIAEYKYFTDNWYAYA